MEVAEEWIKINDLEDRITESDQAEQIREKRIMENENRLRKLSDSIKGNNISITALPEKRERRGGRKFIRNNSWKHAKYDEGNRNSNTGCTESP